MIDVSSEHHGVSAILHILDLILLQVAQHTI